MILPIYLYGQQVLRKPTQEITSDYPSLTELIKDMFDTMYNADGIGLAAPQVGLPIKLFVIDLAPLADDKNPEFKNFKKVFINAKIIETYEGEISLQEGCLSLPGIHENVVRPEKIRIKYMDENFLEHDEVYDSFYARCIQHEYDHAEGKLFIDKISGIRKQLIKSKLNNLLKGQTTCSYKVKPISSKHK